MSGGGWNIGERGGVDRGGKGESQGEDGTLGKRGGVDRWKGGEDGTLGKGGEGG